MSGVERAIAGKVVVPKFPKTGGKAEAFFEELKAFLRKSRAKEAARLLKTLERVSVGQTQDTPDRVAFVGYLKKHS